MSPSDPIPPIHQPDGMDAHTGAEEHGATKEDAVEASKSEASKKPGLDSSVGHVMAVHCALTSLSVTASVVTFDYAMGGDSARTSSSTLALLSNAAGDLVGRTFYGSLLHTGEHRKVMALQAFLQGGVLFIMAVTDDVFLLAPIGFGLGAISSSLDMLPVPVLHRYIEPDAVERHLAISRAASGIGCLLGPVLAMVFRDGEMESYAVFFLVSGLLSVIAGTLWLLGLRRETGEARGKTAVPGTPEATAGAKLDGGEPAAAGDHSPPLPRALQLATGDMAAEQSGSPEHAEAPGETAVALEAVASPPAPEAAGGAPPDAPA
ncbi:hypothetical protein MRX96_031398 [Rhipicephalus microplus]